MKPIKEQPGPIEPYVEAVRQGAEELRTAAEKLTRYGRIGQKVGIFGRSISSEKGEVIGKIIAIESNLPFDKETIESWERNSVAAGAFVLEGLPICTVKVLITEGKRKGETVEGLTSSEWEPVE